jgi:hypothetical protein
MEFFKFIQFSYYSQITLAKEVVTKSIMDTKLPKHLEITLDTLLNEGSLSSWTIQGNANLTTVIIRFKVDTVEEEKDMPMVKYKRVPPSQLKRDSARAGQWKDSLSMVPPGDTISSQSVPRQDQSNAAVQVTQKQDTQASPAPVTTRSHTKLNTKAKPFQPSPLPQVDGPTDTAKPVCSNTSVASPTIDSARLEGQFEVLKEALEDLRSLGPEIWDNVNINRITNQGSGHG